MNNLTPDDLTKLAIQLRSQADRLDNEIRPALVAARADWQAHHLSWPYGTGLAKVTVDGNGNAEGRIIGRSSFMQARAQAAVPVAGDLSARTAYADSERETKVPPTLLDEWMPAFLAQLAAPGAQLVRAARSDGTKLLYLFDPERESFAQFTAGGDGWTVRQGGPVALWDDIEAALVAWQNAGSPDIDAVQLRVTAGSHTYWIENSPSLRWEHRLAWTTTWQ